MKEKQLEAFVEASDIAVPEDLVQETTERMITEAFHRKRYEYLEKGRMLTPQDVGELVEGIPDAARKHVKTRLVLKAVIEQEKFEVTQAELEREAEFLAQRERMTVEAVKDFLGEDLASLKEDILFKKAIDFITT